MAGHSDTNRENYFPIEPALAEQMFHTHLFPVPYIQRWTDAQTKEHRTHINSKH